MKLNKREMELVMSVFDELTAKGMANELGSYTIVAMNELSQKIRLYDFCKRNGVKYEDLTDEDLERAYHEEWDS